jgi:hypothetical protein
MPSEKIINDFDQFLSESDLQFEGIVIGGTALVLMGVIDRSTP